MRNYQKYNSRRISAKGTLPMSTDPDGRINVCERCRRNTELYYSRDLGEYLCDDCISLPRCEHCEGFMKAPGTFNEATDEFWCDSCISDAHEAAYERHQEWLMENGPGPSLLDQQAEARKLK